MAANNTLEFILRLNVEAFRQGLQQAVSSLTGLSGHAAHSAQGVGQLGTQIQQAGQAAATLGTQVQQAGQAAQGVGQLGTQAQQASTAVASLSTAVSQLGTQTQQAGQSAATLGTQVQQTGTAVGALSSSIGQTGTVIGSMTGGVNQAGAAVGVLASSMSQTGTAVSALAGSAGQAGTAVGTLAGSIGQTGTAVSALSGSAGQIGTAVQQAVSQTGTAVQVAQSAATSAVSSVQHAVTQTGAAVQHSALQAGQAAQHAATSAVSAVQHAVTQTGAAVQQTAQQAGQAAESLTRFVQLAVSIGAMGFLKSAVSEFAGFESAMLKVQALSGAVGADFDKLNAKAAELGASTQYTAAEAAAGMSQLAAAGYNTAQILDAIGPAMYAAAAGGSDLGETADQLTNIMGVFQLAADQAGRVADVLAAGFTGAATTMSELAYAMKPAGAIANALGYSLEQTVAVLQAMANVGYKGEQAGTALRNAMAALLNPTADVTKTLQQYNIEVTDSEGKFRAFADILEDMGKAGVSAADMLKIFGAEAGPAMQAVLGQGADAIREYEQKLTSAGGTAKRIADHMQSGLEGAFNRLSAAWSELKKGFGAEFAPVVGAVADSLAKLAGWFAGLPEWARNIAAWTLAFTALSAVLPAVIASLKMLFSFLGPGVQGIVAFRTSVGVASAALQGFAGACLAGKLALGGLVAAAIMGVVKIAEFAKVLWECKRAADEEKAAEERLKKSQDDLAARLERISQQSGITVKSFAELRKAVDEGRLHYDSATKTWVAGAQKQVAAVEGVKKATGEALKEMQKQYQEYAKEIRRLQDEISGRQRSLAAELREMGRTGMSDSAAWQDQKREAEEYVQSARRAAQEAKAAFASGDTITAAARWREAVQYADDARSAYRQLNTEVKEGDQVVVSKADALKTAMDGVKQAGELGVSILKEQQEVAAKAMDELVGQSGFADLTAGMSKAEKLWLESWRNMQTSAEQAVEEVSFKISAQQVQIESIEQAWLRSWANNRNYFVQVTDELRRRLDEATRPRTVTVYTAEVVRRATGGLINAFARGGRLPGYGGGDRVSALLEAGEFVIRKEAVKHYGAGFFAALNSLRLPDLSGLVPTLPSPALAGAGPASPTRTVNINLNVGAETYQMQTDERTAARLERWYALRSSNRLTRADFRG